MPETFDQLVADMRKEPPLKRLQYWLLYFAHRCKNVSRSIEHGLPQTWSGWRAGLRELQLALDDAAPILDGPHVSPADAPSTRLRQAVNAIGSVDGLYARAGRRGADPESTPADWPALIGELEAWANRVIAIACQKRGEPSAVARGSTVIDLFGLPIDLQSRVMAYSLKYIGINLFQRGVIEFCFLLGSDREFISIARMHAADPTRLDPRVFAENALLVLKMGRDRLLAMLAPAERADPASRFARSIDATTRLFDGLTSVPFARVMSPSGSLYPGPWVSCFAEVQQARQDVLGLTSIPIAGTQDSEAGKSSTEQVSWPARAVALRYENPTMTIQEIAKLVGKDDGTIYRKIQSDPDFASRIGTAPRGSKGAPVGSKDSAGAIEAADPAGYNANDKLIDLKQMIEDVVDSKLASRSATGKTK